MRALMVKALGVAVFVACLCVLQNYWQMLEFDRQKVLSGEVWRIWTGHLVHTNSVHLALNMMAAIIIYFAFFVRLKIGELFSYGFVFAALISVALLCLYPGLAWYNGLSGLLHALVACCSVRLAREGHRVFWAGLLIVWAKVLFEVIRAYSGYEYRVGDMTVIIEAHLIGVFVGTVTAYMGMAPRRPKSRFERGQVEAP